MHTHADSRKLGACDLDCLESFYPSFTRGMALGKFTFAQASTWSQHPLSHGVY